MTAKPRDNGQGNYGAPLNTFSQCHAGILSQLDALAGLPALMTAAQQARSVAASTLSLFQNAVFAHHAEEERELFPAVLRSAHPGDECDRVQALSERLTGEHRTLEVLWKKLEPAISAGAKGKAVEVDDELIAELVRAYRLHALFEEEEFLPLADVILGRNGNHMAALGLALHLRHANKV